MQIEWWYWVVAGLALMLTELAIPVFVLLWFGCGALLVGLLLAVMPTVALSVQLGLWLLISSGLVWLWFRVFRPGQFKTRVGMADGNVIGEVGLMVEPVAPFQKGRVRFQKPLLGSDVWVCIADHELPAGSRVRVLEVEGSMLKVDSIKGETA